MMHVGGKSFGKSIRVSPMPKAPDGKSLPEGLPKADIAMSKRHRLQAISFHRQHAQDHIDKANEHRAALKNGVYKGVRAHSRGGRASLSDLIAKRQNDCDGSCKAPSHGVLAKMTR